MLPQDNLISDSDSNTAEVTTKVRKKKKTEKYDKSKRLIKRLIYWINVV